MSRSRSGTRPSVSLFPFLAVLICAMGALIFLLIAITQEIRSSTIAQAQQDQHQQSDLKLDQPDEQQRAREFDAAQQQRQEQQLQREISKLQKQLDAPQPDLEVYREQIDQLRKKQRQLSAKKQEHALQSHAVKQLKKQLKAEFASAQRKRRQIEQEISTAVKNREKAEQQLPELAQQIEEQKTALVSLRKKVKSAESAFQIVPFDGKLGTARRPIFIECAKDHVRFLPEDVTITKAEIKAFGTAMNPVVFGVRALKKYWSRTEPGQPEPYVILVLRPSGVEQYKHAHLALLVANQKFGYELIEEQQALSYPPADPAARAILEHTIRDLLQQRQQIQSYVQGRGVYRDVQLEPKPYVPPVGVETPVEELNTLRRIEFPVRKHSSANQDQSTVLESPANQLTETPEPARKRRAEFDFNNSGQSDEQSDDFSFPPEQPLPEKFAEKHGSAELQDPPRTLSEFVPNSPAAMPQPKQSAESQTLPEAQEPSPTLLFSDQKSEASGQSSPYGLIGYERDIVLESHQESLIFDGELKINISETATSEKIAQTVKQLIAERVRGWGKPPEKFYWLPNVQLKSSPGGNLRALMLREQIKKWGMTVKEDVLIGNLPEVDFVERRYEQAITIK